MVATTWIVRSLQTNLNRWGLRWELDCTWTVSMLLHAWGLTYSEPINLNLPAQSRKKPIQPNRPYPLTEFLASSHASTRPLQHFRSWSFCYVEGLWAQKALKFSWSFLAHFQRTAFGLLGSIARRRQFHLASMILFSRPPHLYFRLLDESVLIQRDMNDNLI